MPERLRNKTVICYWKSDRCECSCELFFYNKLTSEGVLFLFYLHIEYKRNDKIGFATVY